MGNPSQDELYPQSLVLPHFTDSERNALLADVGTIIYNTTDNKLDFCIAKVADASSWSRITSVTES